MEDSDPQTWSVRDVCDWLESLDLSQYVRHFESLRIDGDLLFQVTDQDLEMDLNVKVRLHRVKLLEGIKRLRTRREEGREGSIEADGPLLQASDDSSEIQVHAINMPDSGSNPGTVSDAQCELLVLKAIEGPLMNNTFIIGAAGATLGRHTASNDIVVSESFVSRRHCDIKYAPSSNQFLINDVGSTTGTFIMLQRPTPLSLNLMFQMGLSEFKVTNIKFTPSGAMVLAELKAFEGPSRHNLIKVTPQGLTIGRDQENSLCIRDDNQMSSRHGKIEMENGVFLLSDLGSTNKTWLRLSEEGQVSHEASLVVGDVVKIGTTVMLVLPPDVSLPSLHSRSHLSDSDRPEDKVLSEETECKICFARESNCAFYPCGHMFCKNCATRCRNCPSCRKAVSDLVTLYK